MHTTFHVLKKSFESSSFFLICELESFNAVRFRWEIQALCLLSPTTNGPYSVGLKMEKKLFKSLQQAKDTLQIGRASMGDNILVKKHSVYDRDRRLMCEDERSTMHLSGVCGMLLFFCGVDKDVGNPR